MPIGEIGLLPGFEDKPLIIVGGTMGICLVNPQLDYQEPLMLLENSAAFGQKSFFFKEESFG